MALQYAGRCPDIRYSGPVMFAHARRRKYGPDSLIDPGGRSTVYTSQLLYIRCSTSRGPASQAYLYIGASYSKNEAEEDLQELRIFRISTSSPCFRPLRKPTLIPAYSAELSRKTGDSGGNQSHEVRTKATVKPSTEACGELVAKHLEHAKIAVSHDQRPNTR